MKRCFSFCLYGTEPNYYIGLLENIKLIREWFPEFDIFVYKGICDPTWEIPNATIIETTREGAINMLYRYLPLKNSTIGFIRDADSRITERDRWCISEFLSSPYNYHMIRDHAFHKSRLMGGLFGWKKPLDIEIDTSETAGYGDDEAYIARFIYPNIVNQLLVHTNITAFHGEHSERIRIKHKGPTDFVGNVIWNGTPKFTNIYNLPEFMKFARSQDQFELMVYFSEQVCIQEIPYNERTEFLNSAYIAHYYLGNIAKAQECLCQFEFTEISQNVYENANYLLKKMGTIVACFDTTIEPKNEEVMIYYGNYPDWHLALPCSNKVYRHISKFFDIKHDKVIYHPAWESIDIIYILNLEERVDRFYDTLLALASVQAPLHRIYHYKAKRDGLPPYVGATKNHVDCIEHFCNSGKEFAIVLEDDFVFIDKKEQVWSSFQKVFSMSSNYNICFLSLSKFGERNPYTDTLIQTVQECTTSSGYILQKKTAQTVLDITRDGLIKMQETGDHHTYCIDRYWSTLPLLVCIRPKLGFQRPSYSNLLRTVSAHLD